MTLFDKRGIPVMVGDVVKVFHFMAALRREKRFMYKLVVKADGGLMTLSHLNLNNEHYIELMDGRTMKHWEIVQGYGGVQSGQDFRDRKRNDGECGS